MGRKKVKDKEDSELDLPEYKIDEEPTEEEEKEEEPKEEVDLPEYEMPKEDEKREEEEEKSKKEIEAPPEVENPYTIANKAIDELVNPRNTMYYLKPKEIDVILKCYEFAILPVYFGEEPVTELVEYCNNLKTHLLSHNGRGRKDVLRVLKFMSGITNENVNKNIFRQFLESGKEEEESEE